MRRTLSFIALAAAMIVAAPGDAEAQKKSRDKLTQEEIATSALKDQDLRAAIRGLKPHFLEGPRGVRTIGGGMQYPLVVYVDGIRASGSDVLDAIRADEVQEVKYLDATRSQNEYGITANGGALQIKLRQRSASDGKKPENP